MRYGDEEIRLYGKNFLVNIALPENTPSGLFSVNRDPRKQRKKPDAYAGIVTETGPGCIFVKTGDKIVFRRWEYQQLDVDDEHLVANERDLIILNGETPAPGIIVLQLIEEAPKTSLVLPDTVRIPKPFAMRGTVIKYSEYGMGPVKDIIKTGKTIYFQRCDSDQWYYGNGLAAIKVSRYFDIFAIEEKTIELSLA